jgi:6-hydroxytryprostatin B O-methyltransferase
LRYIVSFNLAQAVPLNGSISYAELAAKTKVDADQMKRSIRQGIQTHVFYEPQPGYVGHTAASKLLLKPQIAGSAAYIVDDSLIIAANVMSALEKWGHGSQEPNEAGLSYAFKTDKPMFQFFEEDELRRQRFSFLMRQIGTTHLMSTDHVATGFDWASLGECTIVDVGGNRGHCAIPIARANPKATIIVQDLPELVLHAQSPEGNIIPPDLRDRITFMAHNFYEPQPIRADVYFIRLILHDYSDKYAARILSALIPAMKPGNRLILMEQILPPVGAAPPPVEHFLRTMDLVMWSILNGKERELGEFTALLKEVDQRLNIKNVVSTPGSSLSIIEILMEEYPNSG